MKPWGRRLPAAMRKREGVEPRNNQHHTGLRVTFSGSQYQYVRKGECVLTCRGQSPQRVDKLFMSELGRTISCPRSSSLNRRGEAEYGGMVVGLIHSRGVGRVMPVEPRYFGALEGVSNLTQGDKDTLCQTQR